MLTARVCVLVMLATAALTACSGDDAPEATTTQAATAPGPASTITVEGQNELPERPQVMLDFRGASLSDLVIDPAARGRIAASALELQLREAGAARAAPREQPPDDARTALVITRVHDPQRLVGRAGIFCRGGDDGDGYELTLDRVGRVHLDRVAAGRRTTLARGQARLDAASPPDSPIPLFLVCGRGDEPSGPNVVFTVGAQAASGVRDPSPLPPGSGMRSGMVVSGGRGDRARFTVFTLTYGP